ncbi:MAG: HNH endonuclease [Cyanobacteria bacterium J06623_4]
MNPARKLQIVAAAIQQQVSQAAAESVGELNTAIESAKQSGERSQQQLSTALGEAIAAWQSEIATFGTSGMVTANALKDLPRTAQALAEEMPELVRKLKTAGVRLGDPPRTDADIMGLFDKIPGTSKLGASERDIRVFLSDKHGSHIHPHSKGGSNSAKNMLWERNVDNLRRGSEVMTGGEQLYIRFYNAADSIVKNSTTIAKLGITATGTAVLTQALVTALAYTLDLHRGDITPEEFKSKIIEAAVSAGIATPIFFVIFIAVMAVFPEVVVLLSAPAVVAGFNVLFGIGVALPIIESLVRHIEADGFGSEWKAQYEGAIFRGEAIVQDFL